MIAIATALVSIVASLLLTRMAAVALTATGMNRQVARFQARSAFSGVGFTTSEAEAVVHHPVRRRIIMVLMLLGNAGIITVAASLILSFEQAKHGGQLLPRLALLLAGLIMILVAANSPVVDRRLTWAVGKALGRWANFDSRDYARLMHLAGDYGVSELAVRPGEWLADKTLAELGLREEGIVVLGIHHPDGSYSGAPTGEAPVETADTLIVYGRSVSLAELDRRRTGPEGDRLHDDAVAAQDEIVKAENEARASRRPHGGSS